MNQSFSKIWVAGIVILLIVGGIFAWQYFDSKKEGTQSPGVGQEKTAGWQTDRNKKNYEFEKITEDFNSIDFMDRRLINIRDNGERDIIVPSMRSLMGWERVPREAGFYPVKVSFPPDSSKIFFVKYMAGSGHSGGLFMLDTETLQYKELPNSGKIYENYLNVLSRVSPDGFRVASLDGDVLYVLDLLRDETKILAQAKAGEVFFAAQEVPEFTWIDDVTIQYPVSSQTDFTVIAVKRITAER